YLIDLTLLQFAAFAVEFARERLLGTRHSVSGYVNIVSWVNLALTLVYFTVGEGWFGATVGKWLVRLRVVRLGEPGPPGLARALVRTVVFNLLWYAVFVFPFGVYRI